MQNGNLTNEENQKFEILMELLPFPKEIVCMVTNYLFFKGILSGVLNIQKNTFIFGMVIDKDNIYCHDDEKIIVINRESHIINKIYRPPDTPIKYPFISIALCGSVLCVRANNKIVILRIPNLSVINSFQIQCPSWQICAYKSLLYITHTYEIGIYVLSEKSLLKKKSVKLSFTPSKFCVDDKNLYITDFFENRLLIMTLDSKLLYEINNDNTDGTIFIRPTTIIVSDDCLYFCDRYWVRQCTKTGCVIKRWKTGHGINTFSFLDGQCYVAESSGEISVFE